MLNLLTLIVGQLRLVPTALRHILMLTFCLGCVSSTRPAAQAAGEPAPRKSFHVFTKRDGNCTRFFVDNREANEVTATFELQTVNLKGSTNFPFSGTYPANQVTEAFWLVPVNPD